MDTGMMWNALLTIALALVSWNWNSMANELRRVTILLNRTREEMAKEYVTKAEVHADINRVIDRLEALDAKLDRFFDVKSKG